MPASFYVQTRPSFLNYFHSIPYKLTVSRDAHRTALERAELFAGDFAAYLGSPEVTGQLGLDEAQRKLLHTLDSEARDGNFIYQKPITFVSGFPFLQLQSYNKTSDLDVLVLTTQGYNVKKGLPVVVCLKGYTVTELGPTPIRGLGFLFSPRPITTDNISDVISKKGLAGAKLSITRNRVLIETGLPEVGLEATLKYQLIGEMEWSAEPSLLVYAFNNRNLLLKEQQEATAGEFSLDLS